MEHTALRPKPMPGQDRRDDDTPGPARRPHAAPRRGRRLRTLLSGLCAAVVLVLCGVGIGTVGATVAGTSRLAELRRETRQPAPSADTAPTAASAPAPAAPSPALGVEAVDAPKAGALVVGVHVPGPGYAAGLVRGDIVLQLGSARVDTAADLARAVARVRPGKALLLTVRHSGGGYQQLAVIPAVVT
ncbi:PDZ domain-containing protein [Streptomyces capoamus]|uniref:PDZ domain-containing protein n=1 Tax=Streptomyces capoamus TaxID=68183 RepID=A0A919EXZ8_9ACTN|nr:PDZ domain-containing protein [Streptomyces capoamus]GGW20154.1 PDZ domain-containing protein [Streptomyces libani subsp. rufus]GHG58181.1 PDZ domain-containing protein [Streptomyces capoamus]